MLDQIGDGEFAGWGASPLTLRQAVIERLRDAIILGMLKPGELLRDTALANRLGVSATPIREALGDLAAEGLIEIEARRLKRVTPIDSKAMADLFLVQGELWRLGYVWGMPKVGRAGQSELEAAISHYRVALSKDDALGAIRAGHAFHTVFITASGNGELLRSTLDRRSLIARFILLHGRETLSENGLQLHEAMLGAFREGAYPEVLSHLDRLTRRLFQLATAAGSTAKPQSKKVA
ncbi:GntR family transcriptional regulator [Sphingomonas chungangi]|nr:GntR family transcriptional regulator [Sphingomonas chungangi]